MGAGPAGAPYNVSLDASTRMYRELTERRVRSDPRPNEETMMTTKDLDAFFEAGWNGHDVDRLMTFMSDDCVFESIAGPEACGTRHVPPQRVCVKCHAVDRMAWTTARAAGVVAVGVRQGFDPQGLEESGADVLIDHIRELPAALAARFVRVLS